MKLAIFAALAAVSSLAIATPSFAQEDVATMKVCTGIKGGNYEYSAKALKAQVTGQVNVEIVNTAGSAENLKKLASGECDAAMVQSDAVYVYTKDTGPVEAIKAADMYREFAHLLCNRASGIDDLGDLSEKTKILLGPNGSGSQITWRGMVLADKEFGGDFYSPIPTMTGKGTATDLGKVVGGDADCLFYVGTPGNKFMMMANQRGEEVGLIPVEDKDFDDPTITDKKGNTSSIWTAGVLPSDAYASIMPKGALWGNKSLDTVAVTASFYISSAWADANDDANAAVILALPDVKKNLKADKGLSLE